MIEDDSEVCAFEARSRFESNVLVYGYKEYDYSAFFTGTAGKWSPAPRFLALALSNRRALELMLQRCSAGPFLALPVRSAAALVCPCTLLSPGSPLFEEISTW